MSLEGKLIGRYRFLHVLGSGGMGDVYLAEDARIGQQVAIKIIRSEVIPYSNSEAAKEAARLFEREAKAIVKLDHPNILPLFDYGEERLNNMPLIYLVMPYRPEGSLADWLHRREQADLLPPSDVMHFVRQAAKALQHAHSRQIIHQDVKPSNFLIRSQESQENANLPDLLLADFGISRLTTATSSSSHSNAVRGTPTYMAPEQWEGEPVLASDQYALAVMAYELLTGHSPFKGTPSRMMYQHINVQPAPPSSLNPGLSREVDAVLLHALAKNPQERFASISAFANALQLAVRAMQEVNTPTFVKSANTALLEHTGFTTSIAPSEIDVPTVSNTGNQPTVSNMPVPLPTVLDPVTPLPISVVPAPITPLLLDSSEMPRGVSGPSYPAVPASSAGRATRVASHRRHLLWAWGGASVGVLIVVASVITALLVLVHPSLSLTDTVNGSNSVRSGGMLHLHGSGFVPGNTVSLTLDNGVHISPIGSRLPNLGSSGSASRTAIRAEGTLTVLSTSPFAPLEPADNSVSVNLDGSINANILVDLHWSLGPHTIHASEGLAARNADLHFTIIASSLLPPSVAKLSVSPSTLNFGTLGKGTKAVLVVIVQNIGGISLSWTVDSGGGSWLKTNKTTGTVLATSQDLLYVIADTNLLKVGSINSATLRVSSNGGTAQIPTSVQVGSPATKQQAKLDVNPTNLAFGLVMAGTQATLPLTIGNLGTLGLNWQVKSGNTPWLKLDTSAGSISAGGFPQTINVTADTTQLATGSYSATLSITSNGGQSMVSVTLAISSSLPPIAPSALTVSPTDFTNGCLFCTVTLTPAPGTQSDLAWFASNSGINGVSFSQSKGILSPGQSVQVTISIPNTSCPVSTTISFAGPINTVPVSWSCPTPPPQPVLMVYPPDGFTNGCSSCIVTLAPAAGSQGALGWRASASGLNGISFSQTGGMLSPGQSVQVTVSVPTTNCPASATFTFTGPGNTVNVPWSCMPPPAQLNVTPSSLDFGTLSMGTSNMLSMQVSNRGGQTLNWSADTGGMNWLTLSPTSSSVQPNSQQTVSVTANATNLAPGNYSATLNVTSNGGNAQVAVALVVATQVTQAHMTLSATSLDFGTLNQGSSKTLQEIVGNSGGQTLTWSADTGGASWVTFDTASGSVQPGTSQTINVTVNTASLASGSNSTTLNFTSNGGNIQVAVTLIVSPPPAPPTWSISKTQLNGARDCSYSNAGWTCSVMVSTPISNQSNANWSVSAGAGISFTPASGNLTPGNMQSVSIFIPLAVPTCPSTWNLYFNGPTNILVQWSCDGPQVSVNTSSINANTDCSHDSSGQIWTCIVTVTSDPGNQGYGKWFAGSPYNQLSFNGSSTLQGTFLPGQQVQITVTVTVTCPFAGLSFNVDGNNINTVQWNC